MGLLHNPAMPNLLSRVFDGGRNIVNWMSITLNGFNNGIWIYSTNISNTKYWLFPGILLGAFGTRYAFVILKDNYFTRDHLQVILSKIATSKALAAFIPKPNTRKLKEPIILRYIWTSLFDLDFLPYINTDKDYRATDSHLEHFQKYDIKAFIRADSAELNKCSMNKTTKLYVTMFNEIMRHIMQFEACKRDEDSLKTCNRQLRNILCRYMPKIDKSHGVDVNDYYFLSIYPIEVISLERIENAFEILMVQNARSSSYKEIGSSLLDVQLYVLRDLDSN